MVKLNTNKQYELGQYMTPEKVALIMCEQIRLPISEWRLLDPACGNGNLLLAAAEILKSSGVKNVQDRLIGIDIDSEMVKHAKKRLSNLLNCSKDEIRIFNGNFLTIAQRDMFAKQINITPDDFNIVIANPPYGDSREYRFFELCNLFSKKGTEIVFLVPLAFIDRVENISYVPLDGRPLGVTTGHAIVYHQSGEAFHINTIYGRQNNKLDFQILSGVKLYELGAGTPPQTRELINRKPYSSDLYVENWLPCVRTGDIQPFQITLDRLWVNYGPHLANSKEITRFSGPRLFVRRVPIWKNKQLGAAYIEELALCAGDILIIKHSSNNVNLLKGLCVYLNSPEAADRVLHRRPSLKHRDSFPKISAKDLHELLEHDAPTEEELRLLSNTSIEFTIRKP